MSFKVNEYFDGKVTSLAFSNSEGRATVGVMAPGEYEFGTNTVEYMTVVSGKLKVLLPGKTDWEVFEMNQTFIVGKDCKFRLIVEEDSAYKCIYK